jgi:large subunit ribosomal protein L21
VYAVLRDRNQQTRVQKGDVILCDLNDQLSAGDKITFDEVLIVGNEGQVRIGKPTVAGAKVTAEVIGHEKGVKVIAFRFKRRKNVRKKRGFRAQYTRVRILDIVG